MKKFTRLILAGVFALVAMVRAEDKSIASPSAAAVKSAAGFYHPGVLVNRAQLDFIKANVAAGNEPWKSAFEAAKSSPYGSLSYEPKPRETVECGPYSKPDLGCKDEQRDSAAASSLALTPAAQKTLRTAMNSSPI